VEDENRGFPIALGRTTCHRFPCSMKAVAALVKLFIASEYVGTDRVAGVLTLVSLLTAIGTGNPSFLNSKRAGTITANAGRHKGGDVFVNWRWGPCLRGPAMLTHALGSFWKMNRPFAIGIVRACQIGRESRPSEHEPSETTGTTRYRFHFLIQPFRGFLQLTQPLPWIRDDRKFSLPEMRQP
jgi:hypothetical protein